MQTTEQIPQTASGDAKKAAAAAKKKKIDAATGEGEENGPRVSSERAFADFVFGSLILHAFCVNFIN
jgi:oligosaccharyltransferase complex subunit epsilon